MIATFDHTRETLVRALIAGGAELRGNKFRCISPDHTDRHASAGIYERGGKWRWKCQACGAGGDAADVEKMIGKTVVTTPKPKREELPRTAKAYPTIESAVTAAVSKVARDNPGATLGTQWLYHDAGGEVCAAVVRVNLPTAEGEKQDKEFRPVHLTEGGWAIGKPAGLWPLYRLPELAGADCVHFFEGEKCADAGASVGLVSTTTAQGAKSAKMTDFRPLAKVSRVVIWPDHDDPSESWVDDVVGLVRSVNPKCTIRVVRIASHVPDFPKHGDFADFVGEFRECQESDAILAEVEGWVAQAEPIGASAPTKPSAPMPVLTCVADVEPRQVSWLWPNRIPRGRISLIVGRPGEGKSFVTMDGAARVTTGRSWPDQTDCPKGSVVLIAGEDDVGDTIRPRLDAAGADVRRVHVLSGAAWVAEDGERKEIAFTLENLAMLEAALVQIGDCRWVIVDPIGSYLGGDTDAHRDNEVRAVLTPLARLAEKYGVAVTLVVHRRKGGGSHADDLALGSRAFTGIARTVWHLSSDPANKARRLLLPGKNNLAAEGDGLAFTIEGNPPAITWEPTPVTMNANDALAAESAAENGLPGPEPTARSAAEEWLRNLLKGGAKPVAAIQEDAEGAGLAWRTVQRAADALNVTREKRGFGAGWAWSMPSSAEDANEDAKPT